MEKMQAQEQEQQPLKCPRCDSTNTKFCYYNNYNLAQPRHFCKSCRRYWTKGGALRNIPVGGGTRKNSKRSVTSAAKKPTKSAHVTNPPAISPALPAALEQDHRLLDFTAGSFSSLLASSGNFVNLLDGSFLGGPGSLEVSSSVDSSVNDSNFWPGSWADLSIYTPGPTFQ